MVKPHVMNARRTVESTSTRTRSDPASLRVVSVPAAHPYVAAVTADPSIRVLEDPPVAGAAPGVWWPPAALDPEWIRAHQGDADLLHVHFGTESLSTGRLSECFDAARDVGWPVVVTVHDLEHPQLTAEQQPHYREQLGILLTRADALITLTDSAAAEIRRRVGRDALVVPHPRLAVTEIDAAEIDAAERASVAPLVLLPLGDLRPNVAGAATAESLVRACALLAANGAAPAVRVTLRRSVRDDAQADVIRGIVASAAGLTIELRESDRSSDSDLERDVAEADIAILPYRHGTHSGWLELCWDLGLGVLAPDLGCYAGQHTDVLTFDHRDASGRSLADALSRALDAPLAGSAGRSRLVRTRRAERRRTDADARRAHLDLYRELTAHE